LIAADIEERPLQKVANEQKVSLSAIKSRVSRGRQQLKALLLGCCEITLQRSGAIDDFKQKQPQCGCSE
jgi:RNA polymerase sigma-70 factor (ECF subfamily)